MKTIAIILVIYLVVTFLMLVFWVWWRTRGSAPRSPDTKPPKSKQKSPTTKGETFDSVMNDPIDFRDRVLKNRLN